MKAQKVQEPNATCNKKHILESVSVFLVYGITFAHVPRVRPTISRATDLRQVTSRPWGPALWWTKGSFFWTLRADTGLPHPLCPKLDTHIMAKTLQGKTHPHTHMQMKLKIVRGETIPGLECSTLGKGFCPKDSWDLLWVQLCLPTPHHPPPKKRYTEVLLPGNMTYFGKRIFTDVIKLGWEYMN